MSTYKLWMTQGQGGGIVAEYHTLAEALEVADRGRRNKEGSFGIEYPNGAWHEWDQDEVSQEKV